MDAEIAEVVRQHGWFAAYISDHKPPFLYSVWLMQTCSHPELIVFGLDGKNAHALLSAVIRDIRAGHSFAEPGVYSVKVGGADRQIGCHCVHPTQHPLYLGFAMGFCRKIGRTGELEAVQLFWPDAAGEFPFEVGCHIDVFRLQPRLDLELSPSEVRQFKRLWE
jgi:Domain of unknown function (DUF4262)